MPELCRMPTSPRASEPVAAAGGFSNLIARADLSLHARALETALEDWLASLGRDVMALELRGCRSFAADCRGMAKRARRVLDVLHKMQGTEP